MLDVHRGSYHQPAKDLAHHTKIATSTMPHPTTSASAAAPAVAPTPSPVGEKTPVINKRPGNAAALVRVAMGVDPGANTQVRTQTPHTSSHVRHQALPRAPSTSLWCSSHVPRRHLQAGRPALGRPVGRRSCPIAGDLWQQRWTIRMNQNRKGKFFSSFFYPTSFRSNCCCSSLVRYNNGGRLWQQRSQRWSISTSTDTDERDEQNETKQ